ncbi:YdbL family protein [Desulfoprunum benzoelyticum]|uniref:YdbL family protein n=1 Tax=Desulfoprunum benzoelyticum TaxID=1506996 RepID=UPI001966BB03|nr:YdbL family protein [Desulfoprunum benzoelyticum]MBM9532179.1 YdbL family protein [Desulfoprunum benzoelyticum]
MRTMKHPLLILMTLFLAVFCAQGVFADGIKDRMLARLPVINELKAQGLIGENNQGYLEFRGGKKPNADVINAENADRQAVYKAIAARQKTTPAFVGQTRAAQIAEKESPGTWIQGADGTWKKK